MSQSSVVSTLGNQATTAGSRRSTRIEKSVPLIVLGQNRMGEPFMERTVSVTLNMHGCRYSSRHDYGVGTWVTLQMVGLNGTGEKNATVRAIVRSVHPPESLRELQQVGVELETPSNVWGIAAAPADWVISAAADTSAAKHEGVTAITQVVATKKVSEVPMKPVSKVSEITSITPPAPAESEPASAAVQGAAQPRRVVVTADGLITALQGKLEKEAEKAVQAAAAKQVNEVLREALSSIEEARRQSVREMQELIPKQMEAMKLSLKTESSKELATQWSADLQKYRGRAEETAQRLEKQADELQRELATAQGYVDKVIQEIAPSIPARLKETVAQATAEFEGAAAAIAERRCERLVENVQGATQEALAKLLAQSAEVQAQVESGLNSGLEEFRRETEQQLSKTLAEAKERVVSALLSLDEESKAACDARRQMLEVEVERSAEQAAEQFHKRIKAFLSTCLSAADGVVEERPQSTPDARRKEDRKL
ncbi:MAG TPA: hypothetical protein VNI81_15250 [Candidatus Limnocylindrales bacterium]|nr:hypothetical protein [Candidatus Limnocylindrales bacterium]